MASFPVDDTSTHHCEIGYEDAHGRNSQWRKCQLHPGHEGFYTMAEFGLEHLPPDIQTEDCLKCVEHLANRTVKITVSEVSEKRPDTFPGSPMPYPLRDYRGKSFLSCGTGFLTKGRDTPKEGFLENYTNCHPCFCPECKESEQPKMKYWSFLVSTATHVVYGLKEAQIARVELFYDTDTKEGVHYLYESGCVGDSPANYETDGFDIICLTHDFELAKRLCDILEEPISKLTLEKIYGRILVSHLHGASKRISVGQSECSYIKHITSCQVKQEEITRLFIPHDDHQQAATNDVDNAGKTQGNSIFTSVFNLVNFLKSKETRGNNKFTSKCNLLDFLKPMDTQGFFTLKDRVSISLPSDTTCIPGEKVASSPPWFVLPDNSKLVSVDGKTETVIPKGSRFEQPPWNQDCYLTYDYDMPACPGSSGARVSDLGYAFGYWCHFGVSKGRSRSGIHTSWLF